MKLNRRNGPMGFTLIDFLVVVVVLVVLAMMLLPSGVHKSVPASRIRCTNNLKQIGLAYRQWASDHGDKFPTEVLVTDGGAMEAVLAGDVAMVFRVMSNELNMPKVLFCPADKRRKPASTFAAPANGDKQFLSNANVSYFVGLDANETTPQMFLSGDDNWLAGGPDAGNGTVYKGVPVKPGVLSLWTNTPVAWSEARHQKQGNVGLADGSVQGFSSSRLAEALRRTGAATDRFLFP